jgi:cell division protein FtsW
MTLDVNKQAAARRRAVTAAQRGPFRIDLALVAIVATMVLLGLFMVFSASFPLMGTDIFLRQLQWAFLGVAVFVVAGAFPHGLLEKLAVPIMVVVLALLVAVLAVGSGVNGANRTLFGGSVQPSELAKLALAIYVAAWANSRGRKLATVGDGLIPFLLILGAVALLIALERSFSVTIIVLVIGLTIYFVAGGNIRQMAFVILGGIPVLLLGMSQVRYPFGRIQGWYNIWFASDKAPEELVRINWILQQGQGIGVDPAMWQAKSAVPALYTDYLFANIAADLHIIGALFVLALFVAFGYRAVTIALNAPTPFGRYLASGLAAWVLVQAAIHIGTSLSLIPATGQPLPFMSAGGSSLLSCMAAAGLLLSISRDSTEKTSAYATFAWGWRDWWSRLSRPGSGERTAKPARTARPAVRKRPRPSAARSMASSVPRVSSRREDRGGTKRP